VGLPGNVLEGIARKKMRGSFLILPGDKWVKSGITWKCSRRKQS